MYAKKSLIEVATKLAGRAKVLRSSGNRKYPDEFRLAVIDAISGLRGQGICFRKCSTLVGISLPTLKRWLEDELPTNPANAASLLLPVRLSRPADSVEAAPSSLVLHAGHDLRVTGISLAQIAQLLQVIR